MSVFNVHKFILVLFLKLSGQNNRFCDAHINRRISDSSNQQPRYRTFGDHPFSQSSPPVFRTNQDFCVLSQQCSKSQTLAKFYRTGSRYLSKQNQRDDNKEDNDQQTIEDKKPEKPGIFTRIKETYKEYGKVFIAVDVVTSAMWFATFYYIAAWYVI